MKTNKYPMNKNITLSIIMTESSSSRLSRNIICKKKITVHYILENSINKQIELRTDLETLSMNDSWSHFGIFLPGYNHVIEGI